MPAAARRPGHAVSGAGPEEGGGWWARATLGVALLSAGFRATCLHRLAHLAHHRGGLPGRWLAGGLSLRAGTRFSGQARTTRSAFLLAGAELVLWLVSGGDQPSRARMTPG